VARIKDSSVDAVKAAADIVAVVEDRTRLRKVGSRYSGRCPFHEERTPSFSVNAVDKLYYCFGCQAKGDVITFVRETEGLDFTGAVEWLGRRFNVPIEYDESTPAADAARERRERLYRLLEQAASFYERYLWDADGAEFARRYLESRNLGDAAARLFRLGFAPGGATLAEKARGAGFADAELRAAGLLTPRGRDYFDRRLMFPLADARGRVIGFQARKLFEEDPLRGKYVNSPEGELFHKSALLYGLHLARQTMAKDDRAVIVEGNTDVIALRQAGMTGVVASMGTALTEAQLKEVGRLTRSVYLCFDADAAGQDATLRGMQLAAARGLEVWVVALEPGTDPADDPGAFAARLAKAEKYPLYRVRVEIDRALPDRQAAHQRVREVLDPLPDGPDRHDAWQYANDRLGMTVQLQASVSASAGVLTESASARVLTASDRLERDALAACVAHPELVPILRELGAGHFDSDEHRALCEALIGERPENDEIVGVKAELDARASASGIDVDTGEQLLLRLRERHLRREMETVEGKRLVELQQALLKIRTAIREFA